MYFILCSKVKNCLNETRNWKTGKSDTRYFKDLSHHQGEEDDVSNEKPITACDPDEIQTNISNTRPTIIALCKKNIQSKYILRTYVHVF
jgi:hypothetical protein